MHPNQVKLHLGSSSPRRKELLSTLGIPFSIVVPSVDERVRSGENPEHYLERVVNEKWRAASSAVPRGEAVLVADTIVVLGDEILGKPENEAANVAMLELLAGRQHCVTTRYMVGAKKELLAVESVHTLVIFRDLAEAEMARYVSTGEGLDKAGGYAIQGGAASFVKRIEGSYSNVVGLPLAEVTVALGRLGFFSSETSD
ncbi:MAG: septum formation protein Maf [Polyangiaceae bacterium]|nr:septum formation protein Maf [Polyangiaceae bacterium]